MWPLFHGDSLYNLNKRSEFGGLVRLVYVYIGWCVNVFIHYGGIDGISIGISKKVDIIWFKTINKIITLRTSNRHVTQTE